LGLSRAASTSSLSYINAHRSSELFRDLYYELLNDFHVKTGDNTAAKWMDNPSASVVVADRYYCDFDLLNIWDSRKDNISYVVRHKGNLNYTMIEELELPPDTD
jgi:hypothetical protein